MLQWVTESMQISPDPEGADLPKDDGRRWFFSAEVVETDSASRFVPHGMRTLGPRIPPKDQIEKSEERNLPDHLIYLSDMVSGCFWCLADRMTSTHPCVGCFRFFRCAKTGSVVLVRTGLGNPEGSCGCLLGSPTCVYEASGRNQSCVPAILIYHGSQRLVKRLRMDKNAFPLLESVKTLRPDF